MRIYKAFHQEIVWHDSAATIGNGLLHFHAYNPQSALIVFINNGLVFGIMDICVLYSHEVYMRTNKVVTLMVILEVTG